MEHGEEFIFPVGYYHAMAYYCTDFSITQNWAFNECCVTYDFTASINGTVTIGFSRCRWIAPYTSGAWSVLTTFSLVIRNI